MRFKGMRVLALIFLVGWSVDSQAEDIVETAASAGRFKTLVAAIEAADLKNTLKGSGPYTVFAPTDEAFAALPEGTVASLLRPENKQQLVRILTYHIVPGRISSMEIANIDEPQWARTANGQRLPIGIRDRVFQVGAAEVVRPDIKCSNGMIHVIDKVLLPPELRTEESIKMAVKESAPANLIEALRSVPDGRFSTFVAAVEASGGKQDWAQAEPTGNWTLFIPTNEAFDRLSEAERAALFDPKNRETLLALLDWHALPKIQPWSFEFQDGDRGPVMVSRQNDRFVLDVLSNGMVFVYELARTANDRAEPFKARILAGDISLGGNLVNIVDRVIVPREWERKLLASQAHRKTDVEEVGALAESKFMACRVMAEMLEQTESLDEDAAVPMYRLSLRLLEDVLTVSRNGVMMMEVSETKDPTILRARLRARIDDLDRVWYGMFLKNTPSTTSLAAPIHAPVSSKTAPTTVTVPPAIIAQVITEKTSTNPTVPAKNAPASQPPVTANRTTPDLAWCEVIEKDVDSKIVTNPSLRSAITATGLPWRVRDKRSGIEMLLVPPGQFTMGKIPGDSEAIANEVPAHPVTLTKPFYLGRYEVTREQWMKVIKSTPELAPRQGSSGIVIQGANGITFQIQPSVELKDQQGNRLKVETQTKRDENGSITVTATPVQEGQPTANANDPKLPILTGWTPCNAFCQKAGLRLPTEAEWEFACRAGVDKPRYGELDQISWHRGNAEGRNHLIGGKAANALGFHDMIGNAWEWVNDWYSEYTRTTKTDPVGPTEGTQRIIRGGFFNEPGYCRATLRYSIQSSEFGTAGFRVARNP
jgi:uncharacterized surface protein with fasciclin (FAS1) repeats/formylglycine-generating enzyme required for sulfatase activity